MRAARVSGAAAAFVLAAVVVALTTALASASGPAGSASTTGTVSTTVAVSAATQTPTTSEALATSQTTTAAQTTTATETQTATATQTSTAAAASSTTQTSTTSQATRVSKTSSGHSGIHWDPPAYQCAPYAVYGPGSRYAYVCRCANAYYPGYEYSSGYGYYGCVIAGPTGVAVAPKHSVPRPEAAAAANATTATTVAEPATLPLTGENAMLVAMLGVAVVGAGVLVRRCSTLQVAQHSARANAGPGSDRTRLNSRK